MTVQRTLVVFVGVGLVIAVAGPAYGGYVTEVLSDNPIGYWRLGEAAGAAQAQDQTAFNRPLDYNAFPGGNYGQPGAIVGDADTAVRFTPGSTVSRSNTTDFGFASGQSFSVEYWIKAATGNASHNDAGVLVKGYDSAQARPWYLARYHKDEGKVDFFVRNPAGTSKFAKSSSQINDDQWHHVVGVYDASNQQVRVYVDGAMEHRATGVPAAAYGTNNRQFILGNHLDRALDVGLDEVALYNVALDNTDGTGGIDTANRVLGHYLAGTAWTPTRSLNVDFSSSINDGGKRDGVQDGFLPFDGTESGGTGDETRTYPSLLGAGGTVDVTVGGYTHFRDYDGVTGGPHAGLSELLSDNVLRNGPGTMTLTLEGLEPGAYEMTTYHHSTQFGGGTFDMVLHDATGTNPLFTAAPVSGGTSPTDIATLEFLLRSDGSPVRIDFMGGTSSQHVPLDGFELSEIIPEPATLMMFGLGGVGLIPLLRRRLGRASPWRRRA